MPFLEPCTCPEGVAENERRKTEERAAKAAEEQTKKEREFQERIKCIIGESGMGERLKHSMLMITTVKHTQPLSNM